MGVCGCDPSSKRTGFGGAIDIHNEDVICVPRMTVSYLRSCLDHYLLGALLLILRKGAATICFCNPLLVLDAFPTDFTPPSSRMTAVPLLVKRGGETNRFLSLSL